MSINTSRQQCYQRRHIQHLVNLFLHWRHISKWIIWKLKKEVLWSTITFLFTIKGKGFIDEEEPSHHEVENFQVSWTPTTYVKQPQENCTNSEMNPTPTSTQGKISPCRICGRSNHTALKCWNRFDHTFQPEELPKAFTAMTMKKNIDPL